MIILGIDPGAGGSLAFYKSNKIKTSSVLTLRWAIKCPETIDLMAKYLKAHLEYGIKTTAYIEQVHAMPHDGRSSLFKFGTNYGAWLGILAACGIHTIKVSPQKWMKYWQEKKETKLPKDKTQRKRMLKLWASELTTEKVTLYNADAILIALYGAKMERKK